MRRYILQTTLAAFSVAACFSQGVTVSITPESGNPQGAPNPRWLFTITFQNGAVSGGPYFVDHFQVFTSNLGAIDPTNDACMFQYTNRNTVPRFSIFADTLYIQQYSGPWTDWSSGISENSQCRVWAQDATRTTPQDGPDFTLRFYVEGTSLMEGDYGVRISYGNWATGYSSGWGTFQSAAVWTPRTTLPNAPVKTVTVTSQTSQGATFDVTMSSSGGAGNGVRALTRALLIVNTTTGADGSNACYGIYHRTSHELMLIDSGGNAGVASRLLGTSPGSSLEASSSNCTMDLGQSWYSETSSTERMVMPVTFSNSFINRPGTKNVFFVPIDRPGNTSPTTTPNADQTWPATPTYLISGMVGIGSTGLPGVAINLSGGQFNSATTGSAGNYSFGVVAGRNYSVAPDLANYTFAPSSLAFSNVGANTAGNFGISTIEVPILPGATPPGPPGPTPTPTAPADAVGSVQMCNDLSGNWNDELNTYSLSQNGASVTGTATQPNPFCGTITWQTSGSSTSPGQFSLSFTNGFPKTDTCGGRALNSTANVYITSCSTATFVDTTPSPGGESPIRKLFPGAELNRARLTPPLE